MGRCPLCGSSSFEIGAKNLCRCACGEEWRDTHGSAVQTNADLRADQDAAERRRRRARAPMAHEAS